VYSGGKFNYYEGEGKIIRDLDDFKNDKQLIEIEDHLNCRAGEYVSTDLSSEVKASLSKVFTSSEVR
jgi:hypothetical protein